MRISMRTKARSSRSVDKRSAAKVIVAAMIASHSLSKTKAHVVAISFQLMPPHLIPLVRLYWPAGPSDPARQQLGQTDPYHRRRQYRSENLTNY